jgi:SSS family solute:Na+ symporter
MENEIILIILTFYLSLIFFIGLYSSKKIKNAEGFFLANRKLGLFSLTSTITATVIGGSATIATGALIYGSGLPGLWLDIGGAIGLIVLGLTLAKLVRKTRLFTLPEITGFLFDKKTRFVASILIILTQIAWISLLIQSTSTIISIVFPLEYELLLILITIIFIFYTIIGGQFAVVYTDIIQFLIMVIGICFIATPLLYIQASPFLNDIPIDFMSFPVNNNLGFLPVLSFFFMMFMTHVVGPDIYAKVLSAKDEKTARNSSIIAGILKFIFAISIGLISLSAIVLVPGLSSDQFALALPLAITKLSPIIAGLILAAFISVMLSSADSVLLSSGTVLCVDIFQKKNILISRIGILLIGLSSLILSLYFMDIINTLKLAYTVFTAGLTVPIIFGFYKNKTRVTSKGAFFSLILGGSTSLFWFILDSPYIDAVLVGLLFSICPLIIFRRKK